MVTRERVLVTGAAGRIGRALRPRLARPGRVLRLLDVAEIAPPGEGEDVEVVRASFTDPDAIDAACRAVDAVVHLGGLAGEESWERITEVNIDGTQRVLEAACRHRVPRVVLASSIHAAGFRTRDDAAGADEVRDATARADPRADLPADTAPRPDTYYGVGKAAMEALGSLHHSRFGIDVSCLRIGAFRPLPRAPEDLAAWLSPDDAGRLVEACLRAEPAGFRVLWGISRNTRRWWSLAEGEAIGYHPRDDAEDHRAALLDSGAFDAAEFDPAAARNVRVGGNFCTMPLG
ncbi:NADP-dependent aldehyde dehydrogenase [Actinacidiphila yanglinensis]|uniref:NADP-dependent aldehyde dehydrogenase n=1 Tax=Actinacidiphila yanglinensis TaxID=310779 RepID=A0A1H6AXM6_9ACTN|nr:NAD(P)-dependent oxidoreductase [Actinacidiphila yanglinensis]SEG53142.1 NADP-dependent aldehyde dehydrogenase [Actinacidiphila yanglinensis]